MKKESQGQGKARQVQIDTLDIDYPMNKKIKSNRRVPSLLGS